MKLKCKRCSSELQVYNQYYLRCSSCSLLQKRMVALKVLFCLLLDNRPSISIIIVNVSMSDIKNSVNVTQLDIDDYGSVIQ